MVEAQNKEKEKSSHSTFFLKLEVIDHQDHQSPIRMSKAQSTSKVLVKLLVPAGKASAQPPVGPALGAKGVKAMDFAKEFNARTAHLDPGLPTPTEVTINPDRTFSFVTKC